MNFVAPDTAGYEAAAVALRNNDVIAYPTETVYGLGVNPFSEEALDALFAVKARDPERPALLIVATFSQIEDKVRCVSDAARRCMDQFWPGPLSLLLPAVSGLPGRMLDDRGRLCVRCPAHPVARGICRAWGGPITSTSANLSGAPPAQTAAAAGLPGVALVMDGGVLNRQPPSTVYDPETGRVLRQGAITAAMLSEVVGPPGR